MQKRKYHLLLLILCTCFLIGCVVLPPTPADTQKVTVTEKQPLFPDEMSEDFSFSLTWGTYGHSSYDSKSGVLIKTTDATVPDNYITQFHFSREELASVYRMILDLDITSYPDIYDPHFNGATTVSSSPSMTLTLSVEANGIQKTVHAPQIALMYESDNKKGQAFLSVCKRISDLLTETEEWKRLPEYEFFYD